MKSEKIRISSTSVELIQSRKAFNQEGIPTEAWMQPAPWYCLYSSDHGRSSRVDNAISDYEVACPPSPSALEQKDKHRPISPDIPC